MPFKMSAKNTNKPSKPVIEPEDQAYYLHQAWILCSDKFSTNFDRLLKMVSTKPFSEYEDAMYNHSESRNIAEARDSMWFLDTLIDAIRKKHENPSNKKHFENLEGIRRMLREGHGLELPKKLNFWETNKS